MSKPPTFQDIVESFKGNDNIFMKDAEEFTNSDKVRRYKVEKACKPLIDEIKSEDNQ